MMRRIFLIYNNKIEYSKHQLLVYDLVSASPVSSVICPELFIMLQEAKAQFRLDTKVLFRFKHYAWLCIRLFGFRRNNDGRIIDSSVAGFFLKSAN